MDNWREKRSVVSFRTVRKTSRVYFHGNFRQIALVRLGRPEISIVCTEMYVASIHGERIGSIRK